MCEPQGLCWIETNLRVAAHPKQAHLIGDVASLNGERWSTSSVHAEMEAMAPPTRWGVGRASGVRLSSFLCTHSDDPL